MRIEVASVDSVIVYFADEISKKSNSLVKRSFKHLQGLKNPGIFQLIPSYNSLFITYDIFTFDFESIKKFLEDELTADFENRAEDSLLITIDVFYSKEVGLDLKEVAKEKNLTIEEVITIHSERVYDVYAIGFLPGFAYMGLVDERINTPRLKNPRKKIPQGSVAIANGQTTIYPSDSPGGWKIVGKTAFPLFDRSSKDLWAINMNTQVKFNPISKEEFLQQGGKI